MITEIDFKVTGEERKKLAYAIGETLGLPVKYTRTPRWLFRGSLSHLSGLWEPPFRRMRAIYSGNSEPQYWALLHIFPLYCKYTPLVWIQIKEVVSYDQVSWNPTLEKLRIQWEEHRTELRCIQKHSRQGFEKGSGNQSFMAAGFRHDRQHQVYWVIISSAWSLSFGSHP